MVARWTFFVAVAAAAVALPAAPSAGQSVSDLPGTTWSMRGRIALRAAVLGESSTSRGRLGPGLVEFADGSLTLFDDEYGDVTGTWAPDGDDARRFSGALDAATLEGLRLDLEESFGRKLRREDRRVSFELDLRSTSLRGKLNRSGERLRLKTKLKLVGRARLRGRAVRVRLGAALRTSGRRSVD